MKSPANSGNLFHYREDLPERCCWRCSFYDFSCGLCSYVSWLVSVLPFGKDLGPNCIVNPYGVCDKWLSDETSKLASMSGSFEEFRLRKTALGMTAPTPELDDWFAERKATEKQCAAAFRLFREIPRKSPSQMLPAMIELDRLDGDGHAKVGCVDISTSFETIGAWLKNAFESANDMTKFEDLSKYML